ncbi:unnamed protein product [Leptosia nina]|uniref:Anticodon-binding domain-containing protein n=1 Tax=Leptosia nina TaxID=320188 RepID=A0AAV1JCG4_9NEOP
MHNIYRSWLQSINAKAQSNFTVYLFSKREDTKNICYGAIEKTFDSYPEEFVLKQEANTYSIDCRSQVKFSLIVPKQDVMQYFFQWQRYRKYWWSSITTTPSLFAINDMKYEATTVDTQITANYNCGQKTVECLSLHKNKDSELTATLTCSMSLEIALLSLLLDASLNRNSDHYLRLHNKMAPYKISIAVNSTDAEKCNNLKELAMLLESKLKLVGIKSCLPDFELSLNQQIAEKLKIGVPYTAILNNETLINGIFHLLNSSTMLKEQVHIADFVKYAQLLCSSG